MVADMVAFVASQFTTSTWDVGAQELCSVVLIVRRESGCTGVCRSDSLDKLMQEECVHFRVGAIWRGKRGPFLSF